MNGMLENESENILIIFVFHTNSGRGGKAYNRLCREKVEDYEEINGYI